MSRCLFLLLVAMFVCPTSTTFYPFFCIDQNLEYPCDNVPDGDYPLCYNCIFGTYATCANNIYYERPCSVAYYNGKKFKARMVFDAKTRRCLRRSVSCPTD